MPLTIKTGVIHYKDPTTGNYVEIDALGDRLSETIAPEFDETEAYQAGTYVMHEGSLYTIVQDHAANVTWANTSKIPATVGNDLKQAWEVINQTIDDVSDTRGMVAPYYTDLTFPVSKGQLCNYEGALYKAKQDISAIETWVAAHWDATTVDAENTLLNTALNSTTAMLADAESSSTAAHAHAVKTVFIYDGKLYMATSAIAVGDTIVTSGTGQNVAEVTLADAFPHDVQIDGTSILSNGVANIPRAVNNGDYGVVKLGATSNGIGVHNTTKLAYIISADSTDSKQGVAQNNPVAPIRQHLSVFYGLSKVAGEDLAGDTVTAGQYPEKSLSAISQMLNAPVTVSGSTPSITAKSGVRYICGEVSTLTIVVPASGDVEVIFESGSTATVLTVTPPTGVTAVNWANGFDPTSLDANTRYDLIFTDGEWGLAASWAV